MLRWIAVTALSAAAFEPRFLLIFRDRDALLETPAVKLERGSAYAAFLDGAGRAIPPGSSVALIIPATQWKNGYEVTYYRATYLLAGRRVVPLLDPDGSTHLERLERADYVIAWKRQTSSPRLSEVMRLHDGILYRRIR